MYSKRYRKRLTWSAYSHTLNGQFAYESERPRDADSPRARGLITTEPGRTSAVTEIHAIAEENIRAARTLIARLERLAAAYGKLAGAR